MRTPLRYYLLSVLSVAVVTVLRLLLDRFNLVSADTPFVLFVLAIIVPAWSGGLGPGMLATLLSAAVIEALFLRGGAGLSDLQQAVGLLLFIGQGAVISWLAGSKRRLVDQLEQSRTELEDRVAGRTTELTSVNAALLDQLEANTLITDELRLQSENLHRSNQELQDFASVASHDLQEPLRKIRAFGDRLKVRCGELLNDEGRDYLDRMQKAAGRMQVLIDDLLTFSRVTTRAQPYQDVDLAALVQDVVADLDARIEQTAGQVDVGDLPVLEADPTQIRQLFQNLISNGLKFHRPDVPPLLRIWGECHEDSPEASDGRARPFCDIHVQDNGIGFDEKYLDRIFEIFQRLHGRNSYEGTGIGLAVCRKIVERHGGRITARSREGAGSHFVVGLPLRQSQPEPVTDTQPVIRTDAATTTDHNPAGR